MGITVTGADVEFVTVAGSEAVARNEITTATPSDEVSFAFEVRRRPLKMRAGTSAGGQEIFTDITLYPGVHVITFTPTASPYWVEFRLPDIGYVGAAEGKATLIGFQALPAGDLLLPTPWQEDSLRSLRFEQSFDVAWIATQGIQTRVLERRGAKSWSLRRYQPENGPFANLNVTSTTMTSSSRTGETTISVNAPILRASHVGALLKIAHRGQYITGTLDALDESSETIQVTGAGDNRKFNLRVTGSFTGTLVLQRSVGSEYNWVTYQTHTIPADQTYSDGLDNQTVFYRVLVTAWSSGSATVELTHSNGQTVGVARIHSVEADNSCTADILTPIGKTTATTDWAFSAWSDAAGWPAAMALADGRLWAGRDDRFWASESDDFEAFEIGVEDDDAFSRRVTGGWGSTVWMAGVDRLMIGMDAREAEISVSALDEIATPTTAKSRPRSRRGSADAQGQVVDKAVAFIDRSRKKLFRMDLSGTQYELAELTRLHKTVAGARGTRDGFIEIAVQYSPEPRIWATCDDGRLAVLLFEPTEGVAAWCRLVDPGAFYESVCCLPGDVEDNVYFVVRRTIAGSTVRYTEKLAAEEWETMPEAWRLRSAVEYSGQSTTILTGLSHLEGREVYSWTNGFQQGPFTVSGGQIELVYPTEYAITGLIYEGRWESPRVSALAQDKKVDRVGLLVHRSAPGAIRWGRSFTAKMDDLRGPNPPTFDAPLVEITDDKDMPLEGETSKDARVCISMPSAGPASLLGMVIRVKTST